MTEPCKKPRGFAALDPNERSAIAASGGKAAHAKGTAHRWTSDEATELGKKGGKAAVNRHRFTREEAIEAGRKGGASKGRGVES